MNKSLVIFLLFIGGYLKSQTPQITSTLQAGGCENAAVRYEVNNNSLAINSYNWTFRNLDDLTTPSFTATGNPINQVYNQSGKYEALLEVSFTDGSQHISRDTFTVWQNPEVMFFITPNQGCPPLIALFTDSSFTTDESVITSRKWLWGDGTPETNSTEQTENHTYTSSSLYNPILEVITDKGCKASLTKVGGIFTFPKPTPSIFVEDGFNCRAPHTARFSNIGADTVNFNYTWDFGEGTRVISDSLEIEHTFTESGVFPIKLIAASNTGSCSDSVTTRSSSRIYIGSPVAQTPEMPDSICVNTRISIRADADRTGISNSQIWQIDGVNVSFSTLFNRTFNTAGEYEVSYFTYNSFSGCNSDTVKQTVQVLPSPEASFQLLNSRACRLPHELILVNTSINATSSEWTIDGQKILASSDTLRYIINSVGNHSIYLTAQNELGCSDRARTQTANITLPTVRDFELTPQDGCAPLTVTATSRFYTPNLQTDETLNYIYDWGNGQKDTLSTIEGSNLYAVGGQYPVTVTFLTSTGCSVSTTPLEVNVDSICSGGGGGGGGGGSGGGGGAVGVASGGTDPCANKYTFSFSNQIDSSTLKYWDFEETRIDLTDPVVYTFPDNGIKKTFLVKMVVEIDSTGEELTFQSRVNVVDEDAKFKLDTLNLCRNQEVNLMPIGIDSSNISLFIWDYGDSTKIDTLDNDEYFEEEGSYLNGVQQHVYQDTGSYAVQLTIVDKFGCISRDTVEPVQVFGPYAGFGFEVNPFCSSKFGVQFGDSSTFDQGRSLNRWTWSFGDETSATIFKEDSIAFHIYTDPTFVDTFDVVLEVEDNLGCTAFDTIKVGNPQDPREPEAKFWLDTTLFCGAEGTIFAIDSSVPFDFIPIVNKTWFWGDGNIENNLSDTLSHTFLNTRNTNNYEVVLQVTDSIGCVSFDTSLVSAGYPKARMNLTNQLTVCNQYSFNFRNRSDANIVDPNDIVWSTNAGQIKQGANPTLTFPSDTGTYSIQLKVTDLLGCQDSILQTDLIKIVRPQADFITSESPCPGGIMSFSNTSSYADNYTWNFGIDTTDFTRTTSTAPIGVQYNEAGIFNIQLIASGFNGTCTDTLIRPITIRGPKATFSTNHTYFCLGDTMKLNVDGVNIKEYFWSLGESVSVGTDQNEVNYVYKKPGVYSPTVLLSSPDGCVITLKIENLEVDSISAGPNANIECGVDTATIKGFSFLGKDNYNWSGPIGATFSPSSFNLVTTVDQVGQYILSSDSLGCSLKDTVEVTTSGEYPTIEAGEDKKINCISNVTNISGEVFDLYQEAGWIFPKGEDTLFTQNKLNLSVADSGTYIFKARDRECTSYDTLQISACSLILKDTSFSLCANEKDTVPLFTSYDLTILEQFILDTNSISNLEWYKDSSMSILLDHPGNTPLTDSTKLYLKVISDDNLEIARAEVLPVIHDYVEVDFNQVTNTCAGEDTVQITGMLPGGGTFVSTNYLSTDGQFIAPIDSGNYMVTYTFMSKEGCVDSLTKQALVIEVPIKPSIDDLIYCQKVSEIPNFNIDTLPNHELFWYDDSLKLPLINAPLLSRKVDSTEYYISQKNSLCESAKQPFFVRVDSTPVTRQILGTNVLCEGFQRTLETEGQLGSTYNWSLMSDSNFIFTNSNLDTLSLQIGKTNIKGYVVETTIKGCIGDTSTFDIMVDLLPTEAQVVEDILTCADTTEIEALKPIIGKGHWSCENTSIQDTLNEKTIITGLQVNQTEHCVWTTANGICPTTQDTILINRQPDIQIPSLQLDNKLIDSDTVDLCISGLYDLKASNYNLSLGESAEWTSVGNSIKELEGNHNLYGNLQLDTSGYTEVKWLVSSDVLGCNNQSVHAYLKVHLESESSITLSTYDTCQMTDTIIVTVNQLGETDTGEWTSEIKPNGNLNFWYIDANKLQDGEHKLVWEVDNPGCPNIESNVLFNIDSMITPLVDLTQVTPKCVGDSAVYLAQAKDAGNNPQFSWNFGQTTERQSTGLSNKYSLLNLTQSDTVSVTVTSDERCAFPKTVTAKSYLQVVEPPSPELSVEGEQIICITSPLNVAVANNSPEPKTATYTWYYEGENLHNNSANISGLVENGEYWVEINHNDGICEASISESIILDVRDIPEVNASANGIDPLVGFEDRDLYVSGFHTGEYAVWNTRGDNEIIEDTTNLNSRVIVEDNTGFYWVNFTAHDGPCYATDSVYVVIKKPIKAPNVFTPNGDGENETFEVYGLEFYPRTEVRIHNRWGKLVYKSENYPSEEWNGGGAPEGVYYFTIEIEEWNGELSSHTGVIHLMR